MPVSGARSSASPSSGRLTTVAQLAVWAAPLGDLEAHVDRHRHRAEQQAAVQRLDERAPRRQRDPDAVAGPHAERAEALGGERRGRVQLGVGQRAVVGAQRDGVRARAGGAMEPGFDEHSWGN